MVRLLRVVVIVSVIVAFACGGDKSPTQTPTSPTSPTTPTGMQVAPLRDAAQSAGKLVGAAVQSALLGDGRYSGVLGRHFNYLTAEYEMKWDATEPSQNTTAEAPAASADRRMVPALPGSRGHELWTRDFLAASGLFGVVLKPVSHARIAAMLDGMRLFGMGWSWGGFESLVIPTYPERGRSATQWQAAGPSLRLHIGLEDAEDLIEDLEDGFARLAGR